MDDLKKKFREGQHAEAIAECEARCRREPENLEVKKLCAMMHGLVNNHGRALELLLELHEARKDDAEILFNIGICERELKDFGKAHEHFKRYTSKFSNHSHGWAVLAECQFELKAFMEGLASADRAIKLDSSSVPAWTVRGNCQRSMGQFENALASFKKANEIRPTVEAWLNAGLSFGQLGKAPEALNCFTQAIKLAPDMGSLRVTRGDLLHSLGKLPEAVADYKHALALKPADDETLRKASHCLLDLNQGIQAVQLGHEVLKAQPDRLAAKYNVEWVLSQLVPNWHIPMINEQERNQAYYDGIESVVTPAKTVFEIGTGSGLLAMMAARLGAKSVFACETVDLIADTAAKVVKRNDLQDRVTILAKPSQAVQVGVDLPAKADILVHEIFSSELLGEGVLPAIEDAKQRLLKSDGEIVPRASSIMIALVGGDELGKNLHVEQAFGFDLSDFNAITPRRRWLYREDLPAVLLSEAIEAFRFDFLHQSAFPAQTRTIEIQATKTGLCYGLIQWIRIELNADVRFENHPSQHRQVANWQRTIYGFAKPMHLEEGSMLSIKAAHDRTRPWFDLA